MKTRQQGISLIVVLIGLVIITFAAIALLRSTDTSTLVALIAPKPSASLVRRISRNEAKCAIAAPVLSELVCGYESLPTGKRRSVVESFLSRIVLELFPVLPYDRDAAAWHGLERARQERTERVASFVTGQIAAIATVHQLTVVTANPLDFSEFSELAVEDWTSRAGASKARKKRRSA